MIDPSSAPSRRRFFLERGLRKATRRAGSSLNRLLAKGIQAQLHMDNQILEGLLGVLIGAHAAAHYAPARMTNDVDVLVQHEHFAQAEHFLRTIGHTKQLELKFPNAALELYGSAWSGDEGEIDVLSSPQSWVSESFQAVVENEAGQRVLPLPYLVLMKLDS